ncbi:para-nitrobenzyl esterase [Umbelopsis sp. PMI_123]|nr:para-nitrobenzyl esterase [Umbelopsis sp. PMI_123]
MVQVHITSGILQGFSDQNVLKFLGVPYAAPPTGARRWQSPHPPDSWEGVRQATSFGPICPQTIGACFNLRQTIQSEDCLYLNIWTPTCDVVAKQPVLVWIHGGGNLGGAGSEDIYDGTYLSKKGATVVTINYRLGAFGYLAHPDIGANFGVQDQIAALEWVRANIAAFGGDTANVTIFGESAGAVAVRTLMSCPKAHGLFHRAVLQSAGFEATTIIPSRTYCQAQEAAEALFDRLGVRTLAELQKIPFDVLREASHALSGVPPPPGRIHTPAHLIWTPVVDGITIQDGFPGWKSDVPVLMGCVENEARYFLKPTSTFTQGTLEQVATLLYGSRATEALDFLESTGLTIYERLDKLFTSAIFTEPALQSAKKFAALGRRVYIYHFNRCSPGLVSTNELAKHTAEICYVFGTLVEGNEYDGVDVELSGQMQQAWLSFACHGIPTFPDGREWPMFDLSEPSVVWIDGNGFTIRPFPKTELVSLLNLARIVSV